MSDPKLSYSFDEWCRGHDFSRAGGYNLLAKGQGPETFMVGTRRHVSIEADEAWVKQREQASKSETGETGGPVRGRQAQAEFNARPLTHEPEPPPLHHYDRNLQIRPGAAEAPATGDQGRQETVPALPR